MPYKRKLSFLASLLDDHVSPRILAAEARRRLRWAAYLGQNKKKCFTNSVSRPHSQKGDAQRLISPFPGKAFGGLKGDLRP